MEKRRARIIATVISMILVLAIMCVGIYAAATLNFSTTGGSISFTADDVFATVELEKGGVYSKTFDETTTGADSNEMNETIVLENITFTDTSKEAEIALKITNNFTNEQAINVKFNGSITGEDSALLNCEVTGKAGAAETAVSAEELKSAGAGYNLAAGEYIVITINISLIDAQSGIDNATAGFTMALTRASA